MRSDRPRPSDPATLRRRAEAQWRARDDHPLAEAEARRLLHELQVHEIELKLQHEELEQTRQELEHSLERYAELYDFAPAGYLTLRPDGLIQQANLAAAALLGTERAQLLHQPLAGFVAAASRTPLADLLARAFRSREPETAELGLEAAGRPAVQVQMQAQVASHGRECRLVLTDITARARAQETLREAHAQLACILDGTRDAILVADVATGVILQANSEAARLLGRSREALVGLHQTQVHPPEQAEHYRQRFRNRASEPAPAHREAEVCTAAGRRIPVEVSASTITLTDGRRALVGVFRDLTDRRRGERRERQEARRTARLLELHQRAPQLTTEALYDYVLDAAVTLTDSPEGCLHVLAQDPAVIVFTTCHRAAGETDAPMREADLWAECARRQGPVVGNDAAGSPPPHRFVTVPVIADGRVRLILGVRRKPEDYDDTDVAQLQLLANELDQLLAQRRAEEQLRLQALLLDQISDTVTATDLAGRITYVNDAQIRAFGRPREALLGQSVECFGEDPARGATQREIIETTRTRGSWQGEVVNRDASGREFVVASRTALVRNPAGVPIGMIGVGTDITERVRAEDALRASEARWRTYLQNAPVGVLVADGTGRHTEANRCAEQILGYEAGELIGTRVADLPAPEDAAAGAQHFEQVIHTGHAEAEVRVRRKDDGRIWVFIRATRIADNRFLAVVQDISERKRAEEALRESEYRFHALFNSLAEGVAVHELVRDPDGRAVNYRLLEVNPAFESHTGISAEQARGRLATEVYRTDVAPFLDVYERVARTGEPHSFETESSPLHRSYAVSAYCPRPGWFATVFTDISERKRMEDRLRRANLELEQRVVDRTRELAQSEEHLRLAARGAGFGTFVFYFHGALAHGSPELLELYGLQAGEPLAVDADGVPRAVDPRDRDRFQAALQAASRPGSSGWFEVDARIRRPDGTVRWLRTHGRTEFGGPPDHPSPLRSMGAVTDITHRIEAEAQLRTLQSAVEQSPTVVVITDPRGNIEYVNPRFEIQTGYAAAEALGQNPRILKSGAHPPEFFEQLWRALLAGHVWRGELCNKRKDGTLFWESTAIAPIRDETGRLTHFVATKEDITERRRVAAELRQAKERADAASEAKSRFLATMSHEIRTPMNAILGFAQLMQRDGGLPAQHRQHLTTINRSGEYLLRLINDILDMSKIEAGRMQLTDADFNFHALLDDLAALFRLRTDERELGFEVAREAGVPAWLHADGGKVRQILTNVLGNAIKFTLRGGIRLRTTTEPGPGPDAVRLCVDVTDTGAGIPPEELDRVFEPFEQARTGPQQQGTGTGLGLAISRQLARMLGGDLTVASQVGVGSTFRLTFLARPGRESSPAPSGVPDARRILSLRPGRVPPRILVVDDLESNRSLLRSLLETVGYTVSEATDGVEGVARYEAERPALVLMDRRMPRLDGLEATRRIRAGPAGGSVRILILSANVLGTAEQDWRSAGADGFVGKPFDHEALLAQIGRLLGLEYIYSTPPAPAAARPGPQAVAPLPAGLREQLIKATESGDIARLRELIARQTAPSDPDLARTLGRLAETFEYEAILRLLRDPG